MIDSCLKLLLITISGLTILLLPIVVTGCGGSDDDDDDVVTPPVVNDTPTNPPPSNNGGDPPEVEDPPAEEPPPEEPPVVEEPRVSFQEDILPILDGRCAIPGCHVGNNPEGGLNLTTYDNFNRGGFGGPVFVAGNSKKSEVVRRLKIGDMPRQGAPLNENQIELFEMWIDEGAEDN